MSRKKFPEMKSFSFAECWERIKSKTTIENYSQLSEIIGLSKSNVTKRKEEDLFPVEWAFYVAQRFELTTEWILTGQNSSTLKTSERKFEILNDVERWLAEEVAKNPKREFWFEVEFEKAFQEFKAWKEEKEESEAKEAFSTSRKVA